MPTETKVKSPFRKETVFTGDQGTIDKLFQDVYGHGYCFEADHFTGSDDTSEFNVSHGRNEFEWEANKLKTYKETGEGEGLTNIILNDLCDQGILEEGTYIISTI